MQKRTHDTAGIIFKMLIAFFCLTGIASNIIVAKSAYAACNLFSYYTIQSNLIVLFAAVYSIYLKINKKTETRLFKIIKNGSVLWILVTGLVFHFMLSMFMHGTGIAWYALVSLHYVTPAMALVNWFVFEEKGNCRYSFALYWLAYPVLYLAGSEIRFFFDGFLPYWFLNPYAPYPTGTGSFLVMLFIIAGLFAFFAAAGALLVKLDNFMAKTKFFASI